jgi:hypothetical protein
MKKILKIFLLICIFLSLWLSINFTNTTYAAQDLKISTIQWGDSNRNDLLKNFKDDNFFWTRYGWTKWTYWFLFRVAKDLKNLFFVLATLYLFIIVIRLIYTGDSDEWFNKFKKWVIWTSIWLFVMQAAYSYVKTLYDKDIWQNLAFNLIDNIVNPIIWMLEIFASVVFLLMAIIAFYQLITANWNEETAKKWKITIFYAIIWFILIKLAKIIVEWVYGRLNCNNDLWWVISSSTVNCVDKAEVTWFAWTLLEIINWMNGFVWLIVVIMIIYAWIQVLTSGWDEEKMKKAKKSIIYIAIWLFILIANYLILTFFIKPETLI